MTILRFHDYSVPQKASNCLRGSWLATFKHLHKLLGCKVVWQFAVALLIPVTALARYEHLVLIFVIDMCHLAEEEVLASVLYLHRQSAEPLVLLVHRQGVLLLLLVCKKEAKCCVIKEKVVSLLQNNQKR